MLGGGVGCSRLAVPLARVLGAAQLTLVVNTGDDHWRYGLRVCPDLDTNLYALAGMQDRERGWGIVGDTFGAMEALRRFDHDPWFSLGDRDLATHMRRTELLADGLGLAAATSRLASAVGVAVELLPMTEAEVETRLATPAGTFSFEEWFVRRAVSDDVEHVRYQGIDSASPGPGVLAAVDEADLVVIGPSNPVASIGPILGLSGVREHLSSRRESVVAVTPVVSGVPLSGEGESRRARARATQLASWGVEHCAGGVADLYRELAATFVLDSADHVEARGIESSGMKTVTAATIVSDDESGARLADAVLAATG